jgi:hypothetical protein
MSLIIILEVISYIEVTVFNKNFIVRGYLLAYVKYRKYPPTINIKTIVMD